MGILGRAQGVLEPIATVFVLLASGLLLWTQIESRWFKQQPGAPEDVSGLRIASSQVRHSNGTGPIALVEFTDYECPFCGQHSRATAPALKRRFVDGGTITYIVFNYPLERIHPKARKAAQAAECAGRQGKYWEMHGYLFNHQDNLTADGLRAAGASVGLQMAEFDGCLSGETDTLVSSDIKEGSRLGVSSTPTFFLGKIQSDGSIELVQRFGGSAPLQVFEKLVSELTNHRRRFWLW